MKARVGSKRKGRAKPWPVMWYPPGGKPNTRHFKTRAEAQAFANKKNLEFVEVGHEPEPSAEELRAFRKWRREQGQVVDHSLAELVEDYLDHLYAHSGHRWHKDSRLTLTRFLATTGFRNTSELSVPDCQGWLDRMPVGPTTKRNYWSHLHAWGNWMVDIRQVIESNPWKRVRKPRPGQSVIGIFTAEELGTYLGWIWEHNRAFLPWEVIQWFAGLRVMNAARVFDPKLQGDFTKPPFNWKTQTVDVPGWAMKRKRRLYSERFPMVLWRWLEPFQAKDGWIRGSSTNYWTHRKRAVTGSGIPWKPNAPRYTFASCHLAHFQDPGLTSLLLAHRRSIQLLMDTYDGHATRKEARAVMELQTPWGTA